MLLPFSSFNSDDEIKEIPQRWDFPFVRVSTECMPPPPQMSSIKAGQGTSCQVGAGGRRGPADRKRRAAAAAVPAEQTRPVLSIMSRWKGVISNYQFGANHQSGGWFSALSRLPLGRLLPGPDSPPPSVCLSHGSAPPPPPLPLQGTALDALLIPFHLIMAVRAH